jgi:hypothetical protein
MVHQFPAGERTTDGSASIRQPQASDISRCVELINRTHQGLDLFATYDSRSFEMRLLGGAWGKQPSHRYVYGWQDFFVVEDEDGIQACGGLWDRGRDIRERWYNGKTGEESTSSVTALLDFGHAEGQEVALANLVRYFINRTKLLGRDRLLVPLQQLPAVADLLADCQPEIETRALGWFLWDENGADIRPPRPAVERPYTDLAYW